MKVDRHLRDAFDAQHAVNAELRDRVTVIVDGLKAKSWHFESRLKTEEGFAVKVEAGMVPRPEALEDFLACVLVVPNTVDVRVAEDRLLEKFELVQRRPRQENSTDKLSSDFPFDDLRLYLTIGEDDTLPARSSDLVVFEVQVRTFLQHAWSVSTHDVVYKSDSVSWGRERVAHQIKAMLEHAEIAVENMATLDASSSMPTSISAYQEVNDFIKIVKRNWPPDQLPFDLKRLAQSVLPAFRNIAGLASGDIETLLDNGKARYGGSHNVDWSPYRTLITYLAEERPAEFSCFLIDPGDSRRLFVYSEVLEKLGVDFRSAKGAVVLKTS